jgi:hypothetical protein
VSKFEEKKVEDFQGYHSEWNLGSPGGWDYQRLTQTIGKTIWQKLNKIHKFDLDLDFDDPLFSPVNAFANMLVDLHRSREGSAPGLVAVVAEEQTLANVTENKNLAKILSTIDGITGALMAPQELDLRGETVSWKGRPVSIIFMDFNTDVLLKLHRKNNLDPLLRAVKEHRVINPRGTEPFNVKSMFEVITGTYMERFDDEIVRRTPWTRQFYARSTTGPVGETIADIVEWTRNHWDDLVLKPERGYSGKGVRVGTVNADVDEAIELALNQGDYVVQQKIPLSLWSEEFPVVENGEIHLKANQTDFRCLVGPKGLLGFVGRFGGVPTNVGSGGGFQPLAILRSNVSVRDAVHRINDTIMNMEAGALLQLAEERDKMALDCEFTYLLGPVRIALRPRLITSGQINALRRYSQKLWEDCLTLEKMWLAGELDAFVNIEEEELEIARMNPWGGSAAIIASDGLFNFQSAKAG